MTWTSRCGQYRVQQCNNHFEHMTRYYALILKPTGFQMLVHMKTYRTRKAAERALDTHLNPKPKRKKKRVRKLPNRKR